MSARIIDLSVPPQNDQVRRHIEPVTGRRLFAAGGQNQGADHS
jgi:hypothetical protein